MRVKSLKASHVAPGGTPKNPRFARHRNDDDPRPIDRESSKVGGNGRGRRLDMGEDSVDGQIHLARSEVHLYLRASDVDRSRGCDVEPAVRLACSALRNGSNQHDADERKKCW